MTFAIDLITDLFVNCLTFSLNSVRMTLSALDAILLIGLMTEHTFKGVEINRPIMATHQFLQLIKHFL